MKLLAINGSPRSNGNTELMLRKLFEPIELNGIETELVQIGGKSIQGCLACGACRRNQNKKCIQNDDIINELIAKMIEADAIVLGSPVYFTDVTTEMKAFIDRVGYVARANDHLFTRKIGAAVVVARRAGALHTFATLNNFFLIGQMIVPGSTYWNLGVGGAKGAVKEDTEGMKTMVTLGENISWLMKKLTS
jgi:multimeric flavodoxin WrbA